MDFVIASLASLTVVIVYLYAYSWHRKSWTEWVKNQKFRIDEIRRYRPGDFSKGYAQRESSFLVSGTIFVVVAFSLIAAEALGQTPSSGKLVLAIAAPAVYIWWLFSVQLSTRLMNDAEVEMRILADGQMSETGVLRDLYGEGHGRWTLMEVRRNHWLFYALILIFAATYLA